jgi:hypothetical protein
VDQGDVDSDVEDLGGEVDLDGLRRTLRSHLRPPCQK